MLAIAVDPEWVVLTIVAIVVIAVVLAISSARARKRSQALVALSQDIGFAYEGNTWSDPARAQDLQTALFVNGSARTMRNILTGRAAEADAALFDYSYVVGSGSESQTHAQTVAAFSKDGVALPTFDLASAGIMQKIGDALSQKSIRFDNDPEFSKRYRLHGTEEAAARALFAAAMLAFFDGLDANSKFRFEGRGRTLIVYRPGKRVKPDELRHFLGETSALATGFFALV
jgi:hypothetical protein